MKEIVLAFIITILPGTGERQYKLLDSVDEVYCYRLSYAITVTQEIDAVCLIIYSHRGVDV